MPVGICRVFRNFHRHLLSRNVLVMKSVLVLFLFWFGCVSVRASDASVELSWTPPTNSATVVDGYYICYGTNRGHYYGSNEVCDWATSNCIISGFKIFGGPYYFAATSFSYTNLSAYSNETNWTPVNPKLARLSEWMLFTNIPYVTPIVVSNKHGLVTNYWYVSPYAYVVALTNEVFTNYVFSIQATTNLLRPWIDIHTNTVPFVYTDRPVIFQRFYRLRYIP